MSENLPGRVRSSKRLFLIVFSVTFGIIVATVLLIAAYNWYQNRPTAAKQWKPSDLPPTGIRVTLKSRLLDKGIHYLFEVEPLDPSLNSAFDKVVHTGFSPGERSFQVHFLDSSGLELCKFDIQDFTVLEDNDGRGVGLSSLGTNYSCSPNEYRQANDWTVTWKFPKLESAKPQVSPGTVAKTPMSHTQATRVFVEEWRTIGSTWLSQRREEASEAVAEFGETCKAFIVTGNKERADFSIRFDRSLGGDGLGPSNKPHSYRYSLFDQTGDRLITEYTDSLEDAVHRACEALTYKETKKVGN